jgi:hypothetical protein
VFWKLSGPLRQVIASASHHGPVAYVETDYFGGAGGQAAAVWRGGTIWMERRSDGSGPINEALRLLGVRPTPGEDEFDTLGLGRHRSNEDWLDGDSSDERSSD